MQQIGERCEVDAPSPFRRGDGKTERQVRFPPRPGAGYLGSGQTLHSPPGKYGGRTGRILSHGRIEVDGQIFDSPSRAGIFIRKANADGWIFWRLDPHGSRPLKEVRAEHLRVVSPVEVVDEDES